MVGLSPPPKICLVKLLCYIFHALHDFSVAFLDHWTSKFSKLCSWERRQRNAVPALFPRNSSFSSNYDGIIVFKILSRVEPIYWVYH